MPHSVLTLFSKSFLQVVAICDNYISFFKIKNVHGKAGDPLETVLSGGCPVVAYLWQWPSHLGPSPGVWDELLCWWISPVPTAFSPMLGRSVFFPPNTILLQHVGFLGYLGFVFSPDTQMPVLAPYSKTCEQFCMASLWGSRHPGLVIGETWVQNDTEVTFVNFCRTSLQC